MSFFDSSFRFRLPAQTLTKFWGEFGEEIIEYATSFNLSLVLIGKFNIDWTSTVSGSFELLDIV